MSIELNWNEWYIQNVPADISDGNNNNNCCNSSLVDDIEW